jgi:CubicO group peptidase (beta-lactamase class C family)
MNLHGVTAAVLAILSASAAFAQLPSDAEIRKILADRVGAENLGIGLVAGVIDANGRRVIAYGSLAKNDTRRLDGSTIFEIGSISKVFTSLLLTDMARHGELSPTDPVAKYLPADVKVPERNGRQITLADLSTQSSGLPRLPANLHPKDLDNPYADYTVHQMYDFLSGYELTRDIGSQYEYSNLGVGLLGHVLSLVAGKDYETLVRTRIADPLGMTSTRVTLTPEMKARYAAGHSATLNPVPSWDIPTLAGAVALRSTANDLLIFLAANLGYTPTPLAQAMADQISIRRPAGPDMQIAYGWHVQTGDGSSIFWHNGGTGGFRSYIGFDPKVGAGVVVLSNLSDTAGPDDIGRHLLNPKYPLAQVPHPVEHTEITLDPKLFDRYVGAYSLGMYALLTVSRDGDRYFAQLAGQPALEIFPESERRFFYKTVDAQLAFDGNAEAATTQVTLHQNGRDQVAPRLTGDQARRVAAAIKAHNADVAKRYQAQSESPGAAAAVRRSLLELQAGEPNYALMSDGLADATRRQLPSIQSTLGKLGAIESVTFKGVGAGGADIYEVKFERGAGECRISLADDGRTQGFTFRPL